MMILKMAGSYTSEVNGFITRICADLEKAGVQGVPEYKQRLIANSASDNFKDFLLEGKAALMLRQAGFHVTLREAPDLALEFNNEQLYAEVKHFRLVPYGDTVPLEGKPAWEQVYNVAKSKIRQYKLHTSNILVIENNSDRIDDLVIPTAVNMINKDVYSGKCSGLVRLNGILFVSLDWYNISQKRMVFFYPTGKPDVPLTSGVLNLLDRICSG